MQLELKLSGADLRDAGIRTAVDHADRLRPAVCETWSEEAYRLFLCFIQTHDRFRIEQFRYWAEDFGISEPPTKRAYGFIPVKAAKAGLIRRIGIESISNPAAHCANAGVWEVVK